MGRAASRPLTAAPNAHRDISPDAAPPGFRPATAQPAMRRRSMSAAPERHQGDYQADVHASTQFHAGPEMHGFDGRRSVPLTADRGAPSPAHFAGLPVQNQDMYRSSPDAQAAMPSAPVHAAPQTVPCSPVNVPPAHYEDGMHADKHVSFEAAAASPQQVMHGAGVNQQQDAAGGFHTGSTAPPSPQPCANVHSQGLAQGMDHAGQSITFRADQWQEAQAAHAQATAQNFNRSPTPVQHANMHDGNANAPEDVRAEKKHVFDAPGGLAEKIAAGALGESVVLQHARGRSPERADAAAGDENEQPWNRGVRNKLSISICTANLTFGATGLNEVMCQNNSTVLPSSLHGSLVNIL